MGSVSRREFLTDLIGLPWRANAKGPDAFDCWHLAIHVQFWLFGRKAPQIDVPEHPTWPWMIEQFKTHHELSRWVEIPQKHEGLVVASDGAMVLMARNTQPAHCGVYLAQERGIIHADMRDGVCLQDILTLRGCSWGKLRFYEPR